MDLYQKIQTWTSELEAAKKDECNSSSVNWVMKECLELLQNGQNLEKCDGDVAALLGFLQTFFSFPLPVQYTFEYIYGLPLCFALKRNLVGKRTELQLPTFHLLNRILDTALQARAQYPVQEVYPRCVYDNIPLFMVECDIIPFVVNCFSSANVAVVNTATSFFCYFYAIAPSYPPKSLIVLEAALKSYNLILDETGFELSKSIQLLKWSLTAMPQIPPTFNKLRVHTFCSRVINSPRWASFNKIECLMLMEGCSAKTSDCAQDQPKLRIEFTSIISLVQNAMMDAEPLLFIAHLFKGDLQFTSLHIPELDHFTDWTIEASNVMHLLYSLAFALQNLLLTVSDTNQTPHIWSLLHEFLSFLLRISKRSLENNVYATYLKNIVLHSTTIFTLRKLVFSILHPGQASMELLKFLQTWTGALCWMASTLHTDLFKKATIAKERQMIATVRELEGWLQLFQGGHGEGSAELVVVVKSIRDEVARLLEGVDDDFGDWN